MNLARAIAIAEGDIKPSDDRERVLAFQILVDSGLAFQLPGKVKTKALELIKAGTIKPGEYRGLYDDGIDA